ncbi:hypothetical protein PTW37_15430 [Arthrobacter agilis]|uniref:hypothetical protein n=1 Tax=Arthrobacter agilis TaxID=37921 RepID=UPI002366973E|nr:hypothetical protein [Arthrobacter agilis]WDF33218.1 hypothetical protein PTW37_15430 [Arthrobacter agilis]
MATDFVRSVSRRSARSSFFLFLLTSTGLTAIIVGILAMHVWMGGHGSTIHHMSAPTSTSIGSSVGTAGTAGNDTGHAVSSPEHTHEGVGSTAAGALTPVAAIAVVAVVAVVDDIQGAASDVSVVLVPGGAADGEMLAGCSGDCADEMMFGMCVLAIIVAGVALLLTPAGRALLSTVVRRGPPVLAPLSQPAPAPSLTQLCIRRT